MDLLIDIASGQAHVHKHLLLLVDGGGGSEDAVKKKGVIGRTRTAGSDTNGMLLCRTRRKRDTDAAPSMASAIRRRKNGHRTALDRSYMPSRAAWKSSIIVADDDDVVVVVVVVAASSSPPVLAPFLPPPDILANVVVDVVLVLAVGGGCGIYDWEAGARDRPPSRTTRARRRGAVPRGQGAGGKERECRRYRRRR